VRGNCNPFRARPRRFNRAPTSFIVSHLEVGAAAGWSAESFEEFVKALRTSTMLRELTLRCDRRREITNVRLLEELLTTYNYALDTVTLYPRWDRVLLRRVDGMLQHNKRVRELNPYNQFSSRAAWPRVLEECSRFPALMYHFLRKANLKAFSNQLQSAMAAAKEEDANQGRPTTELETLPASQHIANQVQPLAANQVHPVALMAVNRVQPPSPGPTTRVTCNTASREQEITKKVRVQSL
jgi:hypothetical protein